MRRYDKGFKEEAVKLSDEVGVKQAASQLGLPYDTLAGKAVQHPCDVPGAQCQRVRVLPQSEPHSHTKALAAASGQDP